MKRKEKRSWLRNQKSDTLANYWRISELLKLRYMFVWYPGGERFLWIWAKSHWNWWSISVIGEKYRWKWGIIVFKLKTQYAKQHCLISEIIYVLDSSRGCIANVFIYIVMNKKSIIFNYRNFLIYIINISLSDSFPPCGAPHQWWGYALRAQPH